MSLRVIRAGIETLQPESAKSDRYLPQGSKAEAFAGVSIIPQTSYASRLMIAITQRINVDDIGGCRTPPASRAWLAKGLVGMPRQQMA